MASAPKTETQASADLRNQADRIDDLARALAAYFGRKVVMVTDDKEVVVKPRTERRLGS